MSAWLLFFLREDVQNSFVCGPGRCSRYQTWLQGCNSIVKTICPKREVATGNPENDTHMHVWLAKFGISFAFQFSCQVFSMQYTCQHCNLSSGQHCWSLFRRDNSIMRNPTEKVELQQTTTDLRELWLRSNKNRRIKNKALSQEWQKSIKNRTDFQNKNLLLVLWYNVVQELQRCTTSTLNSDDRLQQKGQDRMILTVVGFERLYRSKTCLWSRGPNATLLLHFKSLYRWKTCSWSHG